MRKSAERVLVTRTQPGAARQIEALERAGFATSYHPVLEVRAYPAPEAERVARELAAFEIVIFVSVHAVAHGIAALELDRRKSLPELSWFAVGAATAAALAAHRIAARFPIEETSEGILAMPAFASAAGKRVLIVAGVGGRTLLDETLTARGARVETLCVYERAARREAFEQADVAHIGAVVVSSADGGRAFADSWRASGGSFGVRVVVPSDRVRDVLHSLGFRNLVLSNGASDAAVVDALIAAGPAR